VTTIEDRLTNRSSGMQGAAPALMGRVHEIITALGQLVAKMSAARSRRPSFRVSPMSSRWLRMQSVRESKDGDDA
jgi:hypothetical protein